MAAKFKKLLKFEFGSFSGTNYIKIILTNILKPKNINIYLYIPGILAKENQVI